MSLHPTVTDRSRMAATAAGHAGESGMQPAGSVVAPGGD